MTVEQRCWGRRGGVSHPLQLIIGLVINSSVTTSPTLAGERMLIPKVSILSEQICIYIWNFYLKIDFKIQTRLFT